VAGEGRQPTPRLDPGEWEYPAMMNEYSFIYSLAISMSSINSGLDGKAGFI
jgi:hypothetical protein